ALHLRVRERGSSNVRPDQHRTVEQLIVGELHNPVVDIAAAIAADVNPGHFRESREQVDFAERVVGAPPNPAGFRPIAAEHPLAKGESTVVEIPRWNANAGAGAFEDAAAEPSLRKRDRSADEDEYERDGDA